VEPLTPNQASLPFNQGVRLFAHNPGQKLTARYLDQGVRIQSSQRGAEWQATFSVRGLPPATSISTSGTRVEYQRGPVIEWYDNQSEGIEQGFIVTSPLTDDGELRVDVAVEGLTATLLDPSNIQLSNHSNQAMLSYSKLIAWDATGKPLAARMEASPGGIALIVADAGAIYPVTIDPIITSLEHKIFAADGASYEQFGTSVGVDGDTAIIGSRYDSTPAGIESGSAFVFRRIRSAWLLEAKLTASDGHSYADFGYAVALSGDTALVGMPGNTTTEIFQGSAYVYTRSGTTWSQQAKLTAADGAEYDFFGDSVALSGNTALVGASRQDRPTGGYSGSAYVFVRSGTTWSQQAKLLASDGSSTALFGHSVSLSGDTALVGAYSTNGAFVFIRSGTIWSQQAKLTASDVVSGDYFGWSVSLSGDTAIVGAPWNDTPSGVNAGSAYVFVRSGSIWSQQAKLTAADGAGGDVFGGSVSVSGNTILVGASGDDTPSGGDAGSAYVFVRYGTTWSQQAKLTAVDGAASDVFGYSVALSGNTALVAAYVDNRVTGTDVGSVYVFLVIPVMTTDTDGDLASDIWETANGFNPNIPNDYKSLDTDYDGISDLMEIFQGTDRSSNASGFRQQNTTSTFNQLKTRYRRSTTQTAVKGTYQWSINLVNWYAPGLDANINGLSVNVAESVVASGAGYEIIEVTATITTGTSNRLFFRLALFPLQ